MDRFTERAHKPTGTVDRVVADPAHAIRALSDADLVRLRALARLWSRRLPAGHGWADLLNEAIARALDGSRQWPPGVPLVSFLSGIMRSICDDQLRRMRRERDVLVRCEDPEDLGAASQEAQSSPDPERILAAAQAVAAIHQMFADDPAALQIISGLAEGLAAREICALSRMSDRDYDAARKRMRRALLRAGLHRSRR